jgi:hypothetical protein
MKHRNWIPLPFLLRRISDSFIGVGILRFEGEQRKWQVLQKKKLETKYKHNEKESLPLQGAGEQQEVQAEAVGGHFPEK